MRLSSIELRGTSRVVSLLTHESFVRTVVCGSIFLLVLSRVRDSCSVRSTYFSVHLFVTIVSPYEWYCLYPLPLGVPFRVCTSGYPHQSFTKCLLCCELDPRFSLFITVSLYSSYIVRLP